MHPGQILVFLGAMAGSLLPCRLWPRLPSSFHMVTAAFASGLITLFVGAAVGIPGFLEHAHANTSLGLDAAVDHLNKTEVYRGDLVMGFSGLSIFTFLLLTPKGWLTLYCVSVGSVRMAAAWFDDAIGDPILTGIDALALAGWTRRRERQAREAREAQEGPEVPDRLVTWRSAGIPECDIVIVSARRKPGWERGAAVFTGERCYRLGEPVEQTIAGRLRTLYPLTEHNDFEAIRRSVHYELPARPVGAGGGETRTSPADEETGR